LFSSLDAWLSEHPDDVEALSKRAWLRASRQDWDGVVADTTRLPQLAPRNRNVARPRVGARVGLEAAIDAEVTLAAYRLVIDADPEVGINALL